MLQPLLSTLALTLAALVPQDAAAEPPVEWRTFTPDGDLAPDAAPPLRYALIAPPERGPDATFPVVLALPPGSQTEALVEQGLGLYWQVEARRRGWVVVSPAAPEGRTFQGETLELLVSLADHLVREWKPEGGRVHLAGVSNGGRSAFQLALHAPERWHSLTVLPGVPPEGADLSKLAGLPVRLFGGADDGAWAAGMGAAKERLLAGGAVHVELELFDGEGHVPASLTGGARLFDALQEQHARALARRSAERAVHTALDDFHDAASQADGERYFGHFAPGAIFLGTDAGERWDVAAFREYASPYFDRGQGWTYVATERWVTLDPAGTTAWFDERLHNEKYGATRGSGVLVLQNGRWRLAQYNLTLPVPNELAVDLVERIRALDD